MKKRLLLLLALVLPGGFLTACNTLEGAGEDIQGAGSAIEREAQENRP